MKKKILFIVPFLSSGGAERVVSIWTSELSKMGVDIHLLLFYRVDNEYKINRRVKIHTIEKNKINYDKLTIFEKLSKLRKKIKIITPEIIIPFISHVGILVSVAKIGLKIEMIETIRNNPRTNPSSKIARIIRNISVLFADKVVVQNERQLSYFPKNIRQKMGIFFNPIDPSFLQFHRQFTKKSIDNVVAIGRLEDQKDYFTMIDAIEIVVKIKPNMRLNIYGEGSLKDTLDQYIYNKKLQEHITINNRINNIAEVLSKNDLYIMSSKWEGMPNSLMEAMAVSLPCISTDCETGPSDLINDKINGRLVPVEDSTTLAKVIIEMTGDIEGSIRMGKNARKTIINYHTPQKSTVKLLEFINNNLKDVV